MNQHLYLQSRIHLKNIKYFPVPWGSKGQEIECIKLTVLFNTKALAGVFGDILYSEAR